MAATTSGPAEEPTAPKVAPLRARAVATGFLLTVPVLYAVTNQQLSHIFSLMVSPIAALLAVILINIPLRRLVPGAAFRRSDLIVIYAITSVAAAAGGELAWLGHGHIHLFAATQDTNPLYRDTILPNLPDWLVVRDQDLVRDMPGGGWDWRHVVERLPIFMPRYLGWGALYLSLVFAMLAINSLMRGAWCRQERLAFPLIQLPVEMTKGGPGSMWRSKAMWIAFGVMFGIDMLNGFNYLFPNIPSIPVKMIVDLRPLFTEPPWSNIGFFPISIFPFMAAIGLFMPSNLLFSFVVFFLLRKLTHVTLASQGIPQHTFSGTAISPGPPFFDEQTWGAVIAMFLGAVWVSRSHLKDVWSDIRTARRSDDGGITHRSAFLLLVVTVGGVIAFGASGGLPVSFMVPYVGLFLIFSIVLTRLRAQLGPPTHEFAFFGPTSIMMRFLGTRWVTDAQATWISVPFRIINRLSRNHPMPYQLEAIKMADLEGINQKRVFIALSVASVIGFFLCYFFLHVLNYRTGNLGWTDAAIYLQNLTGDRRGPDVVGITMTLFGFGMVMVLDAVRFRFPAFPLHPAGYVLSMNFGVDYYWFGLLLALLVKNFVQRYYGLRGYDRLRGVALGILLGEYAAESIWMGMALITQQSTYTISFNDRSLGVQ
jgi:hypothetical protein